MAFSAAILSLGYKGYKDAYSPRLWLMAIGW